MFTTEAMIHSLRATRTVTIKEKVGDNSYIAEYDGELFTAIFNPFSGLYYVDNIYGKVQG